VSSSDPLSEMTSLLLAAEESTRPDGKLFFCRKAIECSVKTLHYNFIGQYPDDANEWKFSTIMKKLESVCDEHVWKKTWRVYNSISAMREIHWTPSDSTPAKIKTNKIKSIQKEVKSLLEKSHGPIKKSISSKNFSGALNKVISEQLPKSSTIQSTTSESVELTISEKINLDEILSVAKISENLGARLDPNQVLKLGVAADLRGSPFAAEGYFRQAMQLFREINNKRGEWTGTEWTRVIRIFKAEL